jgi:hypothetical protein
MNNESKERVFLRKLTLDICCISYDSSENENQLYGGGSWGGLKILKHWFTPLWRLASPKSASDSGATSATLHKLGKQSLIFGCYVVLIYRNPRQFPEICPGNS